MSTVVICVCKSPEESVLWQSYVFLQARALQLLVFPSSLACSPLSYPCLPYPFLSLPAALLVRKPMFPDCSSFLTHPPRPHRAARATTQLSEQCNAVTLDADQHSVGFAAGLSRARESLDRDGASIATFRMPLDELQSRIRDTVEGIPATPDENRVDDAAFTDAVVQK